MSTNVASDQTESRDRSKGPIPHDVYVNGLKKKIESLPRNTAAAKAYRKVISMVVAALQQGRQPAEIPGGLVEQMPWPIDVGKSHPRAIRARLKEWRDWLEPPHGGDKDQPNDGTKSKPKTTYVDKWVETEMPPGFGRDRKALVDTIDESDKALNDPLPRHAAQLLHRHLNYYVEVNGNVDFKFEEVETLIRYAWFSCILEDLTRWVTDIKKEWGDGD